MKDITKILLLLVLALAGCLGRKRNVQKTFLKTLAELEIDDDLDLDLEMGLIMINLTIPEPEFGLDETT